jgi:hypothetical protein
LEDFLLGRKEEKGQAKRRKIGCKKIGGKQIDEFGTFLLGHNLAQTFNVCWNLWPKNKTALTANYTFFGHNKTMERWRNRLLPLKISSLKSAANRLLALFNIRPICG